MAKINLNTLAKKVTEIEGKTESLTIAQVKEVIKITLSELAAEWKNGNEEGVISTIKSHEAV